MDGHLIITAPGRPEQITTILKARVHVECEACREDARLRSRARSEGLPPTGDQPVPGLGARAREAFFQANAPAGSGAAANAEGLTETEREMVQDLAARDREVRRHEEAHARVGGQYAGQPSYSYETGPDGKRYAVGGEVPIDVAPIPDDPEATIAKMDVVKRAALAPAEPSSADRRIAALADAQRLQAIADLTAQRIEARFSTDAAPSQAAANQSLAGLVRAVSAGAEAETGRLLSRAA